MRSARDEIGSYWAFVSFTPYVESFSARPRHGAANKIKSDLVCCSEMLAIMRQHLAPGSIVLMHTIAPSSPAIEPVADLLARRNLKALPLSHMLGSSA
ncbi:MAG: hypothetical protein OXF44_14505 [Anaerolineaceae bacterium]|nr:hypothetical protein [Anaerolineaceae bacterium]MCY4023821.1 hypothetical protein [Anaerolineaceae bacterium]